MSSIGFVPIRSGSKGIRDKNVKKFCGRPLVYWVLKAMQDSNKIDEIYIALDSIRYEKIITQFELSKVKFYYRSKENSTDIASTESVMLEFLSKYTFSPDDIFILSQATTPYLNSIDFDIALTMFEADKYDSLLSCSRVKKFIWTKNKPWNYNIFERPRRQNFKGALIENGGLYISYINRILESQNRISGTIGIYENPEYYMYEIDEEEDWIVAENIMQRKLNKSMSKKKIKLVLTDVDGVLTNSGMYYSDDGSETKRFNTRDGMGFEILRKQGILTGIITSEDTEIVKRRSAKLKVDYLYMGIKNKLKVVKELCSEIGINLNEVAYIGDDINDYELLCQVGYSACPYDAEDEVKRIEKIKILSKMGGYGAFRELVYELLNKYDRY